MIFRATWRLDRLLLVGQEDDAHAALAELPDELVQADVCAGAFGDRGHVERRGGGGQAAIPGILAALRAIAATCATRARKAGLSPQT